MTSADTSGALAPTPDSYTLPEWIKIYNNGAAIPRSHPRYAEVRAIMDQAMAQIQSMHQQQNAADSAAAAPSPLASAAVGFGHGASFGLAGDPDYMAQSHKYNPWATGIGDAAGAGATTGLLGAAIAPAAPILSPLGSATAAGGIYGAERARAQDQNPLLGGAIGAGTTAVGGLVGGKLLAPFLAKGLGRAAADASAAGAEEQIGGISVSRLQAQLAKQGVRPDRMEGVIAAARKAAGGGGAPTSPPVKGTMGPLVKPAPDPLETATITRNAAKAPTTTELHQALQGEGAPATPASKLVDDLRELEAKLGRALTPAEKEQILQARLGAQTSPHDPQAAARSAYHLSEAAGDKDPRLAARRAAGTYSNWDPRQALGVAPIAAASTST